tara:strand:+ start:1541 stop:2296 length:756 start_codon:yes stop_codon:yes gene_type:complete
MKVDFVVPCHPKDQETIELVVNGIRKHTNSNNIYIVSPQDMNIKDTIHIPDSDFAEYTKFSTIKEKWESHNVEMSKRTGWLFQQTLKLYAHKVIDNLTEDYVAVDADTIFIREVNFQPGVFQYCRAKEYHLPYLDTYAKMTKNKESVGYSFISHHMLFNKTWMQEMIDWVEELHGKGFMDVLLDSINYTEGSTFSEWDFYGNYMLLNHADKSHRRQLYWTNLSSIPNESDLQSMSTELDFVSPHAWARGIE